MSLYLDTSVIVPLFVQEPMTAAMLRWIGEQDQPLHVADLAVAEFQSAVSRLIRTGAIKPERAASIRDQFERWREAATESLENAPQDTRLAGKMVCQPLPKLLTPDAIHLATCKRLDLTFVTADFDLHDIAVREGVDCIDPGRE